MSNAEGPSNPESWNTLVTPLTINRSGGLDRLLDGEYLPFPDLRTTDIVRSEALAGSAFLLLGVKQFHTRHFNGVHGGFSVQTHRLHGFFARLGDGEARSAYYMDMSKMKDVTLPKSLDTMLQLANPQTLSYLSRPEPK